MKPIDYGCIFTEADLRLPQRLLRIYDGVQALYKRFCPDAIAMEELFFNKNVKTALLVGQARGTALVSAALNTEELYEYTPPSGKAGGGWLWPGGQAPGADHGENHFKPAGDPQARRCRRRFGGSHLSCQYQRYA